MTNEKFQKLLFTSAAAKSLNIPIEADVIYVINQLQKHVEEKGGELTINDISKIYESSVKNLDAFSKAKATKIVSPNE